MGAPVLFEMVAEKLTQLVDTQRQTLQEQELLIRSLVLTCTQASRAYASARPRESGSGSDDIPAWLLEAASYLERLGENELPQGWSAGWSEAHNCEYYFNVAQKLTQWERPRPVRSKASATISSSVSSHFGSEALWKEQGEFDAWARAKAAIAAAEAAKQEEAMRRATVLWKTLDAEARTQLQAMARRSLAL